jgi:hypothetical protein
MRIACLAATGAAVAVAVAGCAAPAQHTAARQQALAAPSASAGADPNLRPCANAEIITLRLHVPMANWYPQGKPFDAKVAAAVSTAATAVGREESSSSGPARAAIHGWSSALATMGAAMRGRDKAVVLTRTAAAQKSLTAIRKACKFQAGT